MTSARRLAVSGVFLGLAGSAALLLGEGCTGMFAGCEEKKGEAPPPVAEKVSAPSAPVEPLPTPQVDMRKVLLGRALFHDKRLSGDGTISCSSCHSLDTGGAEHRKTSIGIRGQVGPINAPTVLNSGLNFKQFWDGRADSLEEQALGPVANPIEMGASWDKVVETIRGIENYRKQFEAIYPDGVTQANIVNAIAEYERSLVTPSRFDEYLSGNQHALSEEEQKGWELFQKVGCISCHRGPNIGGGMFQKMGLVRNYFEMRGTPLTEADNGRYNVTKNENDRHFFKVPSLRNVELTAPYFHDGSQEKLEDAVRIMGLVQLGKELKEEEIKAIVAFLKSLTGKLPPHARLPEGGENDPSQTVGGTS